MSSFTPMGLLSAVRDLFTRRSRGGAYEVSEEEAQFRRELEEDAGPVGREGTVWGHGPGVHPEDQAAWEWFGEDAPRELEEWSERVQSEQPRLPGDSMLYDLDAGLGLDEFDSIRDPGFRERVRELHQDILGVFRRVTSPDEWIYAIDEPEAGYYYCYRFWPHRASETTKWYVSPVPDGDDEYFVSQDFTWGLLGLFGGFPRSEWQVCVFGQPLLRALAADPPRALSITLRGDAFSQRDPEERALEQRTAQLMLKVGLNCQLARDHGVWTRDLERRYKRLLKLEESPGRPGEVQEVLAGLIARVELALTEAGVQFVPAMSHFDE